VDGLKKTPANITSHYAQGSYQHPHLEVSVNRYFGH